MRYTIIFCLLLGACSKSGSEQPAANFTPAQLLDSVGITKGRIYKATYFKNTIVATDSLMFNSDNSITEFTNKDTIKYTPSYTNYSYAALDPVSKKNVVTYRVAMRFYGDSAFGYLRNHLVKDTAILYPSPNPQIQILRGEYSSVNLELR